MWSFGFLGIHAAVGNGSKGSCQACPAGKFGNISEYYTCALSSGFWINWRLTSKEAWWLIVSMGLSITSNDLESFFYHVMKVNSQSERMSCCTCVFSGIRPNFPSMH